MATDSGRRRMGPDAASGFTDAEQRALEAARAFDPPEQTRDELREELERATAELEAMIASGANEASVALRRGSVGSLARQLQLRAMRERPGPELPPPAKPAPPPPRLRLVA